MSEAPGRRFIKLRQRARDYFTTLPRWLCTAIGAALGAVVVALISRDGPLGSSLLGLAGVVLGGVIAAGSNLFMAQANRRAQAVAPLWKDRIAAYQEGYALWWSISWASATPDPDKEALNSLLNNAQKWWSEHCLYLSNEASMSFGHMILAARMRPMLLQNMAKIEDIRNNAQTIQDFGDLVNREVGREVFDHFMEDLKPAWKS